MSALVLLDRARADGLQIRPNGDTGIKLIGPPAAVQKWKAALAPHKPAIMLELAREGRRAKVLAMLAERPGTKYALLVEDATTDPVVATVAIRGLATFDMEIPQHSYNGVALLELVDKHSKGEP